MFSIPQSTSFVAVFKAYLSSDHVTEATGKTIAITISKAGGAFGNPNAGATNATEISSGWYKVTLDTTDTATLGVLALRGAAATIDDVGDRFYVVSASTGGLTNLDAAISSRMATYTQPSGFLAATFPTGTVANTTNITAGTVTTATNVTTVNGLAAGVITAASIAADAITDAKVASDVTIASVTGAVGSVTGNVGGNVVGSVASVSAAVSITGDLSATMKTSVTTAATAATPAVTVSDKTGFSLASGGLAAVTAWTVAITGNITGNLSGSVGSVTGLTASNLDATISSRLPTSSYAAPDNTSITAIKAKTDNLPASPAAVGSAMTLTGAYDAAKTAAQAGDAMTLTGVYDAAKTAATQTSVDDIPTNAELATALAGADDAVLAAIAALPTTSTVMSADIKKVNGVTVNGDGSATAWGP